MMALALETVIELALLVLALLLMSIVVVVVAESAAVTVLVEIASAVEEVEGGVKSMTSAVELASAVEEVESAVDMYSSVVLAQAEMVPTRRSNNKVQERIFESNRREKNSRKKQRVTTESARYAIKKEKKISCLCFLQDAFFSLGGFISPRDGQRIRR